MSRFLMAESAK